MVKELLPPTNRPAEKVLEAYIEGATLYVYDTYPHSTIGHQLSSIMRGRLRPSQYLFSEQPLDYTDPKSGSEAGSELTHLAEAHGLTTFDHLLRLTPDDLQDRLGGDQEAVERVITDIEEYLSDMRRNGLPEKALLPLPYQIYRTNFGIPGGYEETGAVAHEEGLRDAVQMRLAQTLQMTQIEKAVFILYYGLTEKKKPVMEIADLLEIPVVGVQAVIDKGLPKDLVSSLEVFTPPYTDSLAGRTIPQDHPRPGQLVRKLANILDPQFPNAARDLSLPEDIVQGRNNEAFWNLERATYDTLAIELA